MGVGNTILLTIYGERCMWRMTSTSRWIVLEIPCRQRAGNSRSVYIMNGVLSDLGTGVFDAVVVSCSFLPDKLNNT